MPLSTLCKAAAKARAFNVTNSYRRDLPVHENLCSKNSVQNIVKSSSCSLSVICRALTFGLLLLNTWKLILHGFSNSEHIPDEVGAHI